MLYNQKKLSLSIMLVFAFYAHTLPIKQQEIGCESKAYKPYFKGSLSTYCTQHAFNNNSCKVALSDYLFDEKPIILQDIYLPSKLAAQEKLSLPGNGFGSESNQQYITCLADTRIHISAQEESTQAIFHGQYPFIIKDTDEHSLIGSLGFSLPIESKKRTMILKTTQGVLQCEQSISGMGLGESTIGQFLSDFNIDFFDFFFRGVLDPKNLSLDCLQQKTGFADISLSTNIYYHAQTDPTFSILAGIALTLPTGNTQTGNKVWEIELGAGGATSLTLNAAWYCNPLAPGLAPFISGSFTHPFSFSAPRRVPKIKTQKNEVFFPKRFELFTLENFSEYDSTIAAFADQAVCTKIKYGNTFTFTTGNIFYDIICSPCVLKLAYSFLAKTKDSFCVTECNNSLFKTLLLEKNTKIRNHTLEWNIIIPIQECVSFEVGSSHVIAGKNTIQQHILHTSFTLLF